MAPTGPVPPSGPVIVANQRPVFNDYLQCLSGFVHTDFRELAGSGIDPATVTRYAFRATDEAGYRSSWVYADASCVLD